ncbi:biotin transporter BioY [Salibacterium aidingense]|uniref:biotin transporter BioY n=1 Tax=Salibacterium aidingense TaxID=384933 RepID=UPI003BC8F078
MKTRNMMYMAMFAAVVGVLGLLPPIPIPLTPVPITAQTLGVMLAGSLLGARLGGGSMLIVVLLISAGMPLLSGGRGGIGVLLGPSGGYILSWPIAAFITGWIMEKVSQKLSLSRAFAANVAGGLLVIHSCGTIYHSLIADLPLEAAVIQTLGFLPGDTAKAAAASYTVVKIAHYHPFLFKGKPSEREKAAG